MFSVVSTQYLHNDIKVIHELLDTVQKSQYGIDKTNMKVKINKITNYVAFHHKNTGSVTK